MLAVERRPALVLAVSNSPNRRDVEFAEGVVLRAKQTSPLSIGFSRIDPTIHDPVAYERLHPLKVLVKGLGAVRRPANEAHCWRLP